MQTEQTYADLAVLANKENKVIYKHENSDCELVDQITFQTCNHVNGDWIEEAAKKVAYQQKIINMNKLALSNLSEEANNNISILQDAIDLDMQAGNEAEQIKEWKKYRILLSRIDVKIPDVVFPSKPITLNDHN